MTTKERGRGGEEWTPLIESTKPRIERIWWWLSGLRMRASDRLGSVNVK